MPGPARDGTARSNRPARRLPRSLRGPDRAILETMSALSDRRHGGDRLHHTARGLPARNGHIMTGNQRSDTAMPELPGKPAGNACVMKDNAVPTQGTKDHIRAWLPVRRHRSGGEWLTIVAQNDPMARPPDGSGPIQRRTHSTDGGGSGLVQHVLRLPARTPPWNPHERELCAAPVSVKRCTLSCVRWAESRGGVNHKKTHRFKRWVGWMLPHWKVFRFAF